MFVFVHVVSSDSKEKYKNYNFPVAKCLIIYLLKNKVLLQKAKTNESIQTDVSSIFQCGGCTGTRQPYKSSYYGRVYLWFVILDHTNSTCSSFSPIFVIISTWTNWAISRTSGQVKRVF